MPIFILTILQWLGRIGLGIYAIHEVTETGKETVIEAATSDDINTGALSVLTLIPLLLVAGTAFFIYKAVK